MNADDQLTLIVNAEDQDVILTVDGEGMYNDWYIDNGMQYFYPDMSGSYKLKLDAGSTYELKLVSETGFDDQVLYVSLTAPAVGSDENPAQLVMGENSAAVDGISSYFYGFTATEAGKVEITIDTTKCSDWSFVVNCKRANGTYKYGDTNYSDVEPVISTDSVVVNAGDTVIVAVSTATMFVPGTIYFNASFTAGDFDDNEGSEGGSNIGQIGGGDITVENEPSTIDEPWTYSFITEEPGTLRVVIGECTPGWRYKIYYPNGEESLYFTASEWSVGPDYTHELLATGQYYVKVWAFNEALYDDVAGTVSATLTFTPYSGDVEISKEEYVVSDILLGLGENSLFLDENAITTVFEFTPEEIGVYKFTVGDASALVGYWGAGSFYVFDYTESKTNSLEQTVEAVGPSVMVGVSGVEGEFTMTIERIGGVEVEEQIQYVDYVNVYTPSFADLVDDDTDLNIYQIDINKQYNIVKDSKGFYHLGNINGPVLYANLISDSFDITNAFFGGNGALVMRGKYEAPNGQVMYYDFLNAMRTYATVLYNSDYENGLYPVTEDLMIYLKAYGAYQGWYNPGTSPFEAIDGEFVADSAWLAACCYMATEEYDAPEYNPPAGDYSVAALVVAAMAATAGAVVLTKKKEF